MLNKNKIFMSGPKLAGVLIATVLFVPLAASSVTPAENGSASKITLPALDVPQRRLNVVKSAPLVDEGVTLGTVVFTMILRRAVDVQHLFHHYRDPLAASMIRD